MRAPVSPNLAKILFAVVAAALACGVVLVARAVHPDKAAAPVASGAAAIGGPFRLIDQTGHLVDQRVLQGKWSAVFFGYTFCPDFCPTNLQTLARAQDALGSQAKDFQVVFVSIDPARDTPATLKTYLSNQGFPKDAIGLTGSAAEVAQAAKAYRVYYARSGTGSDYVIDHSTLTYLMDPRGRFATVLHAGATPDEIAREIRAAMQG